MLAHGLGHCPNIKTALAQDFVFAGDHRFDATFWHTCECPRGYSLVTKKTNIKYKKSRHVILTLSWRRLISVDVDISIWIRYVGPKNTAHVQGIWIIHHVGPRWTRGGSVMHLHSGNTPAPYRGGPSSSGNTGRTPGEHREHLGRTGVFRDVFTRDDTGISPKTTGPTRMTLGWR